MAGALVWILLGNVSVDPALAHGPRYGDPSGTSRDRERTVRVTESGVVVQTLRVGDSTVTTYGPDAPEVIISSRRRTASAAIAITPSPRHERRFDPTVFEMSMASGHFSRDEACDFARAIDRAAA